MKTLLTLVTLLMSAAMAQAALSITIQEVGADVLVSGSGTANTTELSKGTTVLSSGLLVPLGGTAYTGPETAVNVDPYTIVSGLTAFGTGGLFFADSGTGDNFGFDAGSSILYLPENYVSGSLLDGTSTYLLQSFSSLGLTLGTTVTGTWGIGPNADSITLTVVPETSTTAALLGLGVLGLVAYRRRKA